MTASSTSTTISDNIEYGIRVVMASPRVRRSNMMASPLLTSTASFSPSVTSRPRAGHLTRLIHKEVEIVVAVSRHLTRSQ
jgi:hypothetical protein